MGDLKVQPLDGARVAQAFPLVQTLCPEVTLPAWRAFADAFIAPASGCAGAGTSGILAAIGAQGYIAGTSCYRVVPSLQHGLALHVDHFMALDLFTRPAIDALARALEEVARASGCNAVHISLPGLGFDWASESGTRPAATALRARGHQLEALCLCKRLNGRQAAAPGAAMR